MANKLVLSSLFLALLGAVTIAGERFDERESAAKVVCIEAEKQALLNFKQDIIDTLNWLSSWVAQGEDDCCKWSRVVCDNVTGHVSELRLRSMWIKGKINPSLLNLKHLTYLDLSYNLFRGIEIPSFLGSIESLSYLDLTMAGAFRGMIPHQLGNLSNLQYLGIGSNDIDLRAENLDWLSGLSSLEHLEMRQVNLSEVSDNWLSGLPSLSELYLSRCDLRRIHSQSHLNLMSIQVLDLSGNTLEGPLLCHLLKNMSHLQILDLSENSFDHAYPDCINTLHGLQQLKLGANNLPSTISGAIVNLTSLIDLDLSGNHFGPSIPSFLGLFHRLQSLKLSGIGLQGVISSNIIANLTSLVSLDLSNNSLGGKIPTFMGNLCDLVNLNLGYNNFGGDISEAFQSLSGCLSHNLKSLHLNNNLFGGQIPNHIRDFKNLTILHLSHNSISGSLPLSLSSLSNLQNLDISSNLLKGVVSEAHFANLTHLWYLSAYGNSLTLRVSPDWIPPFTVGSLDLSHWDLGPRFPSWLKSQNGIYGVGLSNTGISDVIPSWFWDISYSFDWLDLSDNQIRGEIPDLQSFGLLSMLDLSSNELMGRLPHIPSDLEWLDLANNHFSGDISSRLCNPADNESLLFVLKLKNNTLSGQIPDCCAQWPSLLVIELGNNNLSGQIPSSMGLLQHLKLLHLHNNSFTGEIPNSLKNCSSLEHLDLGLNEFVGSIPTWIKSLESLSVLILRSNKLKGHIPVELCALHKLRVLYVAENDISGTIPNCLQNSFSRIANSSTHRRAGYKPAENVEFVDNALLVTKGKENQYDKILSLVTILDLSSNNLTGEIPKELPSLQGLRFLNLSRNHLHGSIPYEIGNMTVLESLDLSCNKLSGEIPQSMSNLFSLNYLNLSYNNFSGEIPRSTQLQSLSASSFLENQLLCGDPLPKRCREEGGETKSKNGEIKDDDDDDDGEEFWFLLGLTVGFVVGYLGVIAPLVLCGFWRRAYFWGIQGFI